MATTELDPAMPSQSRLHGLGRTWLSSYTIIWVATLGTALLVTAAGAGVKGLVVNLLELRLTPRTNPPPSMAGVLLLLAHNLPMECWPVLLGAIGAHRKPLARRMADAVVTAYALANIIPVGAAIGAYGTPLLPYIPQLPLEWAGLALGASAWRVQRRHPMTVADGGLIYLRSAAVLLAAGWLEMFAVAHR